jgi:hypothetical protein
MVFIITEDKPECARSRKPVNHAVLWTVGTRNAEGRQLWNVGATCHNQIETQKLLADGSDRPETKGLQFFDGTQDARAKSATR